jgi:N-succinyldiaminopimelate aminotransferase
MPRAPGRVRSIDRIPGAVFSPAGAPLGDAPDVVPLHVGDTWMPPIPGARMEDLREKDHPGLHRYAEPRGIPKLLDAVSEKLRARNGIACEPGSVVVTAGATGALACAVAACVEPDEEVLILAPFWPLIRGIVRTFRGCPVEVPFFDRVGDADQAVAAVEDRISPRTVALYVSTPSNPTGRILPESWLVRLAELARRHDLWLFSDEVYEDYVYRGKHVSIARFAPERTVSVFSFSKAYGMAGHRVGYLSAPPELASAAEKVVTHTFYQAPTAAQEAAVRALEVGAPWLAEARRAYREAGEDAASILGLPPPEGGTFLFLDLRGHPGGVAAFVGEALREGVALARGAACGEAYEDFARMSFTAAPPDRVAAAVRRLAPLLGA